MQRHSILKEENVSGHIEKLGVLMEHIAFPQTLPELTSPASVTDDVKGH